jgi:hypothetical protein
MGGAYSAVVEDGSAAYWNPAGLASVSRAHFNAGYEDLFGLGLFRYTQLGYTRPGIGDGAIGYHLLHLKPVGEAGYLTYGETTHLLSYGQLIKKSFEIGGGLRYYTSSGYQRASGLGFDFGLRQSLWEKRVRVALGWQDLNQPRIRYDGGAKDILPSTLRLGALVRLGSSAGLSLEETWRKKKTAQSLGFFRNFFDHRFVVRAGLRHDQGQGGWHLSTGGGVKIGSLGLDYAWAEDKGLGNDQTFSLIFTFGKEES